MARLVDREQLLAGVGDAVEPHHRVRVGELLVLHLRDAGSRSTRSSCAATCIPEGDPDERRLAHMVVVLMGEHEKLDVLEAEAERCEPRLERRERLRRARARVDQSQGSPRSTRTFTG